MSIVGSGSLAAAQGRQGGAAPAGPPATARSAAPVDLTGQWVSVVTEDWRWRMVTPPKGDFASLPLNAEGRKVAMAWDLDADNKAGNQCKAYGAGGILRIPGRIRISWQDDATLKLETDAGQQTRLYRFVQATPGAIVPALSAGSASAPLAPSAPSASASAPPAPSAPSASASAPLAPSAPPRTWQGDSNAQWYRQPQTRGLGFGGRGQLMGGSLRAVTRNLRAGYLRKNGVPYSENAVVTEAFYRHDEPNGDVWLTVTVIVEDPTYLNQPFITSTSFRKENDTSKWNPRPCDTAVPLEKPVQGRAGGPGE
jgi:hypothetical protein